MKNKRLSADCRNKGSGLTLSPVIGCGGGDDITFYGQVTRKIHDTQATCLCGDLL